MLFNTKNLKIKLLISFILLVIGVMLYFLKPMIDIYQFAKGEAEDYQKRIIRQQTFIQSLSFSGVIKQKLTSYANENKWSPDLYQLVISLHKETPAKNTAIHKLLTEYYTIKNGNELYLTVNEQIFHSTRVNDRVLKKSGVLQLQIDTTIYPFQRVLVGD